MAVRDPNIGKRTNMRKFKALAGEAEIFRVTEDASLLLYELARRFPEAVDNALFMLGGHVRKRLQRVITEGGTSAEQWLGLSDLRRYRRMDRLRKGEFPYNRYKGMKKKDPSTGKWLAPNLHKSSRDKEGPDGVFGRAARALAFRKPARQKMVMIGALSPSAAEAVSLVQEGRRGKPGVYEFTGKQAVTPRMRRALWAAGFPLSEDTKTIGQEPRPLIPPVFRELEPRLADYLLHRTVAYLNDTMGIDVMELSGILKGES